MFKWMQVLQDQIDSVEGGIGVHPIADGDVDWGSAKGQVNMDDIPAGSTNVHLTSAMKTNYDAAYTHSGSVHGDSDADNTATNETSHADVVVDGDFTSDGLLARSGGAGTYAVVTDNSANWDSAYTHSGVTTGNPHGVDAADVGLGNVTNVDTSDADNISDGSTNAIITLTQETNFEAAYTHGTGDGSDHANVPSAAPSHTVVYAGEFTWSGGGASVGETVTGALASDIVVATIQSAPTEAASMVSAAVTADTVTVTLSAANTSNDAVISYVVLRAFA